MISLLSPYALFLLFLPLVVYFFIPPYKEAQQALKASFFERFIEISQLRPEAASKVSQKTRLQFFSIVLVWTLLVICLAQPVILGKAVIKNETSRDFMVAIDLSKSMRTKDFPTKDNGLVSRWQALQSVLAEFVQSRSGDRLGMIVFGTGAYIQVPFTNELDTWQRLLNSLEPEIAGPATAIGDAIGLSIRVFNKSTSKQKVLLLITDGADTVSRLPPVEAAKVAFTEGIQIYTLAIGNPKTEIKDKQLDLVSLNKVSEITGGKSYLAIDKTNLGQLINNLNTVLPTKYKAKKYQPYTYLYPYILSGVLIYMVFLWSFFNFKELSLRRKAND